MITEREKHLIYVSKKIKELRKAANWTQTELAKLSGIGRATLNQLEKCGHLPSLTICIKLAAVLNVSLGELSGEKLPSSAEINDEAQAFFRRFGSIKKLSPEDQKIMEVLTQSLLNK